MKCQMTVNVQIMPWVLLGFVLLTTVTANYNSPKNVVGLVGSEVILECHRNITTEVVWAFKKPGQEDETSIPGRYRKEMTNYGEHRLILEDIQFADAGTYVCSSAAIPVAFKRSAAYVVVVAHQPYCSNNLTSTFPPAVGDAVSLTCWVTYVGVPGVVGIKMTWIGPDETLVRSAPYETGIGISVHNLNAVVRVSGEHLSPHRCLISFTIDKEYDDVADNVPVFVKDNSCLTPVQQISVRPRDGNVTKLIARPPDEDETDNERRTGAVASLTEPSLPAYSVTVVITMLSTLCVVLLVVINSIAVCYYRQNSTIVRCSDRRKVQLFCIECGIVPKDSAMHRGSELQTDQPAGESGIKTEVDKRTCSKLSSDDGSCRKQQLKPSDDSDPSTSPSRPLEVFDNDLQSPTSECLQQSSGAGDDDESSARPLLATSAQTSPQHSLVRQSSDETDHRQSRGHKTTRPSLIKTTRFKPTCGDPKDISLAECRRKSTDLTAMNDVRDRRNGGVKPDLTETSHEETSMYTAEVDLQEDSPDGQSSPSSHDVVNASRTAVDVGQETTVSQVDSSDAVRQTTSDLMSFSDGGERVHLIADDTSSRSGDYCSSSQV